MFSSMTLPVLATRMVEHVPARVCNGLVLIQETNSSIVDSCGLVNVQETTLAVVNPAQPGTSVSAKETGSTVAVICAARGAHLSCADDRYTVNVLASCTIA